MILLKTPSLSPHPQESAKRVYLLITLTHNVFAQKADRKKDFSFFSGKFLITPTMITLHRNIESNVAFQGFFLLFRYDFNVQRY